MYLKEDIGPWFDHEDKLPNRPLFRHPEALALGQNATIDRPLVEGAIMVLKVIVQFVRFLAVAVYFRETDNPKIYLPLGIIGFVSGVVEAMLSFWKEVAARVHKPARLEQGYRIIKNMDLLLRAFLFGYGIVFGLENLL